MLSDVLHILGVPGSIVTVASAAFALYHGRSILLVLSRIGTWLRIAGLVGFVFVLAWSGLIPGVDLAIDLGTLGSVLGDVWDFLPTEVLPW